MKRKLIIAATLMMVVFLILSTSEAIVIKEHVITKDPKENTSCETPIPNYTFSLDDETAYSWILINGAAGGDDIRWYWYGPDSTLYQEWANMPPPWEIILCSWSPLDIRYGYPEVMPGNWHVDLYYNGVYQFTENFTIAAKSPCTSELIYGEHSEQTELLRHLRDDVLSKTPEGQEIIRLYYELSPAIVKVMKKDEGFMKEVEEMMERILELVVEEE